MKPIVFIHTNDKQMIGAKLSAYSLKSKSKFPDSFDIRIIRLEETPHLYKREGMSYLRKGRDAIWHNNDLQSFSPLRMMVPQLMNFSGRALLIDPDIFAVGDVFDLLNRDMEGKSIICRKIKDGYKSNGIEFYATSSMLLDCKKLTHWQWDAQLDALFNKKLDYGDWISLKLENPEDIGDLEEEWNHFDTLNEKTKLLHNTERSTQPWKTGLPIDYNTNVKQQTIVISLLKRLLIKLGVFVKEDTFDSSNYYSPHPDPNQEKFFLKLLKECINFDVIDQAFLSRQISESNLRKDIFEQLEKVG